VDILIWSDATSARVSREEKQGSMDKGVATTSGVAYRVLSLSNSIGATSGDLVATCSQWFFII
jgi:hypothetical protein